MSITEVELNKLLKLSNLDGDYKKPLDNIIDLCAEIKNIILPKQCMPYHYYWINTYLREDISEKYNSSQILCNYFNQKDGFIVVQKVINVS